MSCLKNAFKDGVIPTGDLFEKTVIGGVSLYNHKATNKLYVPVSKLMGFEKADFFAEWRKRVGEVKAKEATDLGIFVHHYIEAHLLGEEVKYDEHDAYSIMEGKPRGQAVVDWIYRNYCNIEDILIEQFIYSPTLKTIGSIDFIIKCKNQSPVIIDFKTTKNPKSEQDCREYLMQVASYIYAWNELVVDSFKISEGKVVLVDPLSNIVCYDYHKKYLKEIPEQMKRFRKWMVEKNNGSSQSSGIGSPIGVSG